MAERTGPDEKSNFLKRASSIIGLAIVLAHPFADGNGRTARTTAHLIREGYDAGEDIQRDLRTVGDNRPSQGFKIDSYLPTKNGVGMTAYEILDAAASPEIPLGDTKTYESSVQEVFTKPYTD